VTLLFHRAVARTPTQAPKTRNRKGVRNLLWAQMQPFERVTLEDAIAILRAGW